MERKMFGHRLKKKPADMGQDPGRPYNMKDMENSGGKAKDNPPGYEGKEHVRYENPGYSRHHIRYPEDEPHMKSHVTEDEEHEMEDNYHMGVPDQTPKSLEKNLKRAHMLMDAPNQQDPKPLRGNIVHNVDYEGEEDTSGEEEMGPNDMQGGMPKEQRKKMVVAVMKRKMKRAPEPEDEGKEEMKDKRKFGPRNAY
jgi:hypothetical protein